MSHHLKPPPRFHRRIEQHPSDLKRRRPGGSIGQPSDKPVNVGDAERIVSAGLGAGLAIWGLAEGNWRGLLLAGLGAGLVYRGMSG